MNPTRRSTAIRPSPPGSAVPYRNWYGPADHDVLFQRIDQGDYPVIHLSTPPAVTTQLTHRLASSRVRLLTAEKPWFLSAADARQAAVALVRQAIVYRGIDHYLERQSVRSVAAIGLDRLFDGRPVERITGRLWEDSLPSTPAQAVGVLRDLLVHLVSVCYRLLPGAEFRVMDAAASRHPAWTVETDTSARVTLHAELERNAAPILIELSAAKGAPPDRAGKELQITSGDSRLDIDFATDGVRLITPGGARPIGGGAAAGPEPYQILAGALATGEATVGLTIDSVVRILTLLDEAEERFEKPLPVSAGFRT